MQSRSCQAAFAILAALLWARAAIAADDCQSSSDDCVAVDRWNFSVALGAGVRSNPLANAASIPLVVIPHVSFYGKRFFLDDLDLGFTLGERGGHTFNLIASPGYDRVYFFRSDLQNFFVNGFPVSASDAVGGGGGGGLTGSTIQRVPARTPRITYLAGPEWTFAQDGFSAEVDLLHEITDQNHGNEVRAAIGLPLLETHGLLSVNIGITWNSAAIVNYYYGAANVYMGGGALDPFVKIGYALPLGGRWHFDSFAEYERLARSIANSPIVNQRHVTTVFAGVAYGF